MDTAGPFSAVSLKQLKAPEERLQDPSLQCPVSFPATPPKEQKGGGGGGGGEESGCIRHAKSHSFGARLTHFEPTKSDQILY